MGAVECLARPDSLLGVSEVIKGSGLVSESKRPIGLEMFFLPGAVAQLGERLICTQEVAGSIPTSSTSLAVQPGL
jgi:hypothetical protein